MNLKNLLTNLNPFKKPKIETVPIEKVTEAVEALPEKIIKDLDNYKSLKSSYGAKLNQKQQLELMELIARFQNYSEINEYFMTNHKISVSHNLILQYQKTKKWKPVIQELRNKYLLSGDQVAGSHKRVRMERRDKIFEKAMKDNKLKEALIATKHQEEEMEGSNRGGTNLNITLNQYNELSDLELEEKRQEILGRIQKKNVLEIKKET